MAARPYAVCVKIWSTDGKDKCINKCATGDQPGMPDYLRRRITKIRKNVLIRRHLDIENYRVIPSVLDPRKFEYLEDYSLDFEHAYMTTYLAS